MEITIWGARGSIPTPAAGTTRYGGNTTCIEARTSAGDILIFDAGTGIRALGETLVQSDIRHCSLFISHAHWDHLQGLPFFGPIFDPEWRISVHVPRTVSPGGGEGLLRSVFNGRNFPVLLHTLDSRLHIVDFTPGEQLRVGDVLIDTCPTRHPGGCTAYKLTADGWSFGFTGDHECAGDEPTAEDERLERFFTGCSCLLADGQYSREEYAQAKGWGHSCLDDLPAFAARAGVDHLIVTHHDPGHSDEDLDRLRMSLVPAPNGLPKTITFAGEGLRLSETGIAPEGRGTHPANCRYCGPHQEFSQYNDVGMILDSILTEARKMSRAEGGTVYLVEGDELVFAYAQNETLFPGSSAIRLAYLSARIPMTTASLAGYTAHTREPLNIPDVHAIAEGAPYSFNEAMDRISGYRTVSTYMVPLLLKGRLLGVLQLINRKGPDGRIIPFSADVQARLNCLCGTAGNFLERALMANELILRMLEMAALRDPAETAGHVRRVGAMAAEIYQRWAERKGVDVQELRSVRDHLRLAAMLHDVGKVGVPDAVLKKPGALTADEYEIVKQHCSMGALLFSNRDWAVDAMAYDVVLHHHQRWDGKGYTGDPNIPLLSGEDIPLAARITSVADVYDALVSRRCYKPPIDTDTAGKIILAGRGSRFDPEVVDAFVEIGELVEAIHRRYPDDALSVWSGATLLGGRLSSS